MLTDEQLAELETMLAKATPLPWRRSSDPSFIEGSDGSPAIVSPRRDLAEFIIAAVNALPDLLAELRDLRSRQAKVWTREELGAVALDASEAHDYALRTFVFDRPTHAERCEWIAAAVARHVGAKVGE